MDYRTYFKGRGINFDRLLEVGVKRVGLSPDAICAGAESLHLKLLNGLEAKDISLASLIYSEAKAYCGNVKVLEDFERRLTELETPWHRKPRWAWLHKEVKLW